jgi:methylenetetrahydrofolate reductase (NADPH)
MSHPIRIGFEVFPPKSGSSETFENSVATLATIGDYVSVTYGASGSGRERSETAINALVAKGHANKIAAHLTASSQSKDQIDRLARDWKAKGIRRIVALRGDAPAVTGDEYPCAAALTEGLSKIGGFDIAVACYPEGHPKSASKAAEMDHLKRKFDAGASEAITQFFFNIEDYLRFRDDCRAAGIHQPIIPGLLPVASLEGLHRFAAGCGAKVPGWLDARFAGLEDDPETVRTLSVATTVSLSDRLIAEGVDHIHLYTLNRVRDALTIARALGITGTESAVITQKEEAA